MSIRLLQNRLATWLALALLLCIIGCSNASLSNSVINANIGSNNNGGPMENQQNNSAEKVDARLVAANTKFGFKLYGEIAKQGAGKNVFVSPPSVAIALAMTYNGAGGETRKAMAQALGIEAMSVEEVNSAYSELKAALENSDPKLQLQIANSLWARKGVAFSPDFLSRNREFYKAEVTDLDFNDAGAPSTINKWVSDKTNGKIEKIIDTISRDAVMFLINAIYFKGKWAEEFDKAKTKEDLFTLADGKQKKHPMMSQSGTFDYFKGENFQAVALPYSGGKASMYVFLPDKGTSLEEFQKRLTAENWDKWITQFDGMKGDIVLPRFRVEYEASLNDALKATGMGVAFDPERADFSAMAAPPTRLFIQQVKHKTFVEVNEEGTEAAAATSVEIGVTSVARPRQTFRMVVDRPFFCAIRHSETGVVLFLGSIMDPQ